VGAYVRHRLISFTLGAPKSRSEIFHVIDGEGFASQAGQPTLNVPAGYGAKLTQASVALTTKWPQKSLVPAGQRPPAISSLRFVARGSRVRLRLNRAAHLVVRVMRGKRVVRTRTAPGRKGVDTVALRTLRRGRYVLVVTAADKAGRTGLAQRSITAP
jgi:hypothetical protein